MNGKNRKSKDQVIQCPRRNAGERCWLCLHWPPGSSGSILRTGQTKAEMITVSLDKDLTAFSTLISVMLIFRMHAPLSKAVR